MGTIRALPFRTADGSLNGELLALPGEVHLRPDETLDAYSDVAEAFDLHIRIDPDETELKACLPPGSGPVAELVEISLTTRSIRSRSRVDDQTVAPRDQTLTLSLDRAERVGRVDVLLIARLKQALDPATGFAHLKGSAIATQHLASIWFDEPPTFSGDSLEVIWRNFDEDPTLEDGHLFAIGLEGRPVIYLNEAESMSPLRSALESKATHGTMARIRDAVFQQIVHQAWTSILGHCFMEVQRCGDDTVESVLDQLDEWVVLVLREWALAFLPEEQEKEPATAAFVDRIREPGNTFLLEGAPAAIQRRFNTMKGFKGLALEFAGGRS